ncbi:MAG: class I SAM-dependent methyltransferase [Proteobacteria bacterium]|nr:class I SAM-dependent methyltransferase [Pseudomonadota bacterium]
MTASDDFKEQFTLSQSSYLARMDFFTWVRHFHVLKDVVNRASGDVLEVGAGDGVLRRCAEPFVASYTVLDINSVLKPEINGDLRQYFPELKNGFDAIIATEVLEHMPFSDFRICLTNMKLYLRPGGLLFLTLPHRKGNMLIVTPRQRLLKWRFPVGLTSLSEAYNKFVRGRIWIDPHHCWEIGDGEVRRSHVDSILREQGWCIESLSLLPYCDYWVLGKN